MILLLLAGCSTISLEELKQEALITGDWAKVEKRELRAERKAKRDFFAQMCRDQGLVMYCRGNFDKGDLSHCDCVSMEALNMLAGGMYR